MGVARSSLPVLCELMPEDDFPAASGSPGGGLAPPRSGSRRILSRRNEQDAEYCELPVMDEAAGPSPSMTDEARIQAIRAFGSSRWGCCEACAGRRCCAAPRCRRALRCAAERLRFAACAAIGAAVCADAWVSQRRWLAAVQASLMILAYIATATLLWPSAAMMGSALDAYEPPLGVGASTCSLRAVEDAMSRLSWVVVAAPSLLILDVYAVIAHLFSEPRSAWLCHCLALRRIVAAYVSHSLQAVWFAALLVLQAEPFVAAHFSLSPPGLDFDPGEGVTFGGAATWPLLLAGALCCAWEAWAGRRLALRMAELQARGSVRALVGALRRAPGVAVAGPGHASARDLGLDIGLAPYGLLEAILEQRDVACDFDLSALDAAGLRSLGLASLASAALEELVLPDTGFLVRLRKDSPGIVRTVLARIASCRSLRRLELGPPWTPHDDDLGVLQRVMHKHPTLEGIFFHDGRTITDEFAEALPSLQPLLRAAWSQDAREVQFVLRGLARDTAAIAGAAARGSPGGPMLSLLCEACEPIGGESAFHLSARRGSVPVLRELLLACLPEPADEAGGEAKRPACAALEQAVSLRDFGGCTALHHAAACGRDRAAELLLLAAADPDVCSARVIEFAAERRVVVARLSGRSVDVGRRTSVLADDARGHGGSASLLELEYTKGRSGYGFAWVDHAAQRLRLVAAGAASHGDDAGPRQAPVWLPYASKGWTPLLQAASAGHVDVCKVLLAYRANANLPDGDAPHDRRQRPAGGWTPLLAAAVQGHTPVVEVLLRAGAFANLWKDDLATPLCAAAQQGNASTCRRLLEWRADVAHAVQDGATPLWIAAHKGQWAVCEVLLAFAAEVDQSKADGATPLAIAAYSGHALACEVLISKGADVNVPYRGATPLHLAAQEGHVSVCEALLPPGVHLPREAAWAPLAVAVERGHLDVCALLVHRGADVNLVAMDGTSALYLAAQEGHTDVCEFLLRHRASLDCSRRGNISPLLVAAEQGRAGAAGALLHWKAHADAADDRGCTPLAAAIARGDVALVRLLGGHRADLRRRACAPPEPGAPAPGEVWAPLTLAAAAGQVAVCQALLDMKAEVSLKAPGGSEALFAAASQQHMQVCELLLGRRACLDDALKRFLEVWEVDTVTAGREGWTTLHIAALRGNTTLCELLLNQGADVNARKKNGATPLQLAAERGHLDLCALIVARGAEPDLAICERLLQQGVKLDIGVCERLSSQLPERSEARRFDATPRPHIE